MTSRFDCLWHYDDSKESLQYLFHRGNVGGGASDKITESVSGGDAGCQQPKSRSVGTSLRYNCNADWQSAVSRTGSPLRLDLVTGSLGGGLGLRLQKHNGQAQKGVQ